MIHVRVQQTRRFDDAIYYNKSTKNHRRHSAKSVKEKTKADNKPQRIKYLILNIA